MGSQSPPGARWQVLWRPRLATGQGQRTADGRSGQRETGFHRRRVSAWGWRETTRFPGIHRPEPAGSMVCIRDRLTHLRRVWSSAMATRDLQQVRATRPARHPQHLARAVAGHVGDPVGQPPVGTGSGLNYDRRPGIVLAAASGDINMTALKVLGEIIVSVVVGMLLIPVIVVVNFVVAILSMLGLADQKPLVMHDQASVTKIEKTRLTDTREASSGAQPQSTLQQYIAAENSIGRNIW
jgi:hypothetical protein